MREREVHIVNNSRLPFLPNLLISCFLNQAAAEYIPVTAHPTISLPNDPFKPPRPHASKHRNHPHRAHLPAKTALIPSPLPSSTTNPLARKTPSTAATTFSKLLLAPFSCVKRAILRFAFRPRCKTVKSSIAKERGGMCKAGSLGRWLVEVTEEEGSEKKVRRKLTVSPRNLRPDPARVLVNHNIPNPILPPLSQQTSNLPPGANLADLETHRRHRRFHSQKPR